MLHSKTAQGYSGQTILERQDLPCMYLPHCELESKVISILTIHETMGKICQGHYLMMLEF